MKFIVRCNHCRTRNTFRVCPVNWTKPRGLSMTKREVDRELRRTGGKRCRSCAYTSFYLDRERTFRQTCHCQGAYHWGTHRPGSPHCESNPSVWFNRALRADPDAHPDDIVIELSLAGLGGKTYAADVIPF